MTVKKSSSYIVGIGASAGGLKALQDLFDHIPADTGMAFVIIQHLSPDFVSLMPELLRKHTSMPIHTAKDKQTVLPNCIYLNQRNKNLHLKGSKLYLLDKGPKHNLNLPVDIFFHTLGEEYKDKAIAVILSGTGSDGSRGIRSISEGGGTIIVQDPASAQFDGMPKSAISTHTVDYVLDLPEIAATLVKKPTSLPLINTSLNVKNTVESYVTDILTTMYAFSGIDFREYKKNTLLRRIEKRMNIKNVHILSDYKALVIENDEEKQALKDDFLIGVTRFFRDQEAFDDLKNNIIPAICKSKDKGDTIRVWIAGCSTGEEVYSIAILFSHYIRTHNLYIDYKILATDIDPRGLAIATAGIYDVNIINELDKNYLEQYFIKIGDRVKIIKHIREKVVFSNHNLIKDPPFIHMDLVSCRNLLIYLDKNIQTKVMHNFQYALNLHGYLFLGNSESLGEVSKYFKTLNTKWKIYQNISETKFAPHHINRVTQVITNKAQSSNITTLRRNPVINREDYPFDKYLSRRYSPDSIFIDDNFNMLFMTGNVGKKLHHNEGRFQNNLLKVVNPDIAAILRNGLRRLEKEGKDITIKNVINKTESGNFSFDLKLHKPQQNQNLNDCYLVEFSADKTIDTRDKSVVIESSKIDKKSNYRIEDLEYELSIAKSELQNTIEELETTNEELQSSNEELMASNEELQSTNEELQSVNEELYTVNSELQDKNKELTDLNNDVTNLLNSTQIATIFLDTDLRIRKFTPAMKALFNLNDDDIGRSLSNFTSIFDEKIRKQLIKESKEVLHKLVPVENHLTDVNDNFYFQRTSPFITSEKAIDGVVITIDNINKIKEIEQELHEEELKYMNLFNRLKESFIHAKIITDTKGNAIDWEYINANPSYEKLIGLKREKLIGKRVSEILTNKINDPFQWIQKYGATALTGKEQTIEGYSESLQRYFHVNTFSPKAGEFTATMTDITALKEKEAALLKTEFELNRVQTISKVGSWMYTIATGKVEWSKQLYDIYKFDHNQPPPNYDKHKDLFTPESWEKLSKAVKMTETTGTPYELEVNFTRSDGQIRVLLTKGEAIRHQTDNKIIGLRGSAQDITQLKENEKALINARHKAEASELANTTKNFFLANMSHEIRTPMTGVLGFADLLKSDDLTREERLTYLEIVDNNSKQLLNLIDDIIDVAKIEANEIKIVFTGCHLGKLITNLELTYNQIKLAHDKPEITFKSFVPDELKNLVLHTDPQRLEQVLCNLLNNALKFSEKGTISFGFNQEDNYLKFFVKDEGIGIAKDKQKEIFERFKQINYNSNAKYGGTGLGLAISKGIVTLLGGDITIKSKRYKGTTFEFTIPLKPVDKEHIENKSKIDTRKKKFLENRSILIAEDNALIRMLLNQLLKNTGAVVTFANNGKIALDYYRSNPNVDLVLLDIRMPEMNGIEAMEGILKINPNAKIIMQTAHAMSDEKELCYRKGCSDFLPKPIVKEVLYQTISKWLS